MLRLLRFEFFLTILRAKREVLSADSSLRQLADRTIAFVRPVIRVNYNRPFRMYFGSSCISKCGNRFSLTTPRGCFREFARGRVLAGKGLVPNNSSDFRNTTASRPQGPALRIARLVLEIRLICVQNLNSYRP